MKNLIQLPWSGKGSKAKNDNTLDRMRGGIRSKIGSMSLKNTSLFGVILTLLLTFGVGQMWGTDLDLYVRGYSTWDAADDTNKMTGTSSPWTFIAYWNSSNGAFKIADNSWGSVNCGSATITLGSKVEMTNDGNSSDMYIPDLTDAGGAYKITVTYESSKYKIQVDKLLEEQGNNGAWVDIVNPKIYWDNTTANYATVSIINGRAWNYNAEGLGSIPYTLSNINHTRLYYTDAINNSSGDPAKYTTTLFLEGEWSGWEATRASIRVAQWASNYTASNAASLNSNTYLFSATSSSKNATLNRSQLASGYTDLNHSQTIYKYTSSGGTTPASYTAQTVNSGTVTISAYKLTAASTASNTSNSATINTAETTSASKEAVFTGEVTLTASANPGYTFVGWYSSTSDTEALSAETSYTYNAPNSTYSVYARFLAEETHDVTVSYKCGSTTIKTATTESAVGVSTPRSITAPDIDGYTFSSWTKGSGITITSGSTSTASITFTSSASGNTLQANYTAKTKVRLYYTNPGGFLTPKAYFYSNAGSESDSGWPGKAMTSTTECGVTYYYVEYYQEDHPYWDRVIFNDNGNSTTQTSDITFSNSTNNNQYNNAPASKGGTGSWTATPPAKWALAGSMNSWSTSTKTLSCNDGSLYVEATLTANTDYTFKFYDTYTGTWYGVTSPTQITYTNKGTARTMSNTNGSNDNQTLRSAAAGTYRFIWNPSTKQVTVNFPTSYKVELEVGTVKGNDRTPTIYHTSATAGNEVTSGNYVAAGTKVIFWIANSAASAPKAGYNWWGFYNNAAGTGTTTPQKYTDNTVSIYTVNSIAANMHVYAVFGENDYTVKIINNGNGDVYEGGSIVTATTAHVATASNTLTATPQTGYKFDSWDQFSDSLTINSPSTASTTIKIKDTKLGNNARLRANYSPQWQVLGNEEFGGWTAYGSNLFTGYVTDGGKNKGYYSITLSANATYEIQAYDRKESKLYGGSTVQDVYYSTSGLDKPFTMATQSTGKNLYIHTAAGGTYQLEWNLTDKKLAIRYPTSWCITTGVNDALGGSFTATDNSSNDVYGGKYVANSANVVFTATPNTGYDFSGWYSDNTCTTAYNAGTNVSFSGDNNTTMTLSSITAGKTVYAKFTPKTYTITLTRTGTGYNTGGDASVTATYNQTLPSVTLPTANAGWCFMGYYGAADGKGTQFINASGTWATSVTDTISDSKWVLDAGATLYAYYKKAEISSLEHAATVAKGDVVTLDVNPVLNVTPADYTAICWTLHYTENDNEVATSGSSYYSVASTSNGSKPLEVRFTLNNMSVGSYYVKAVLKAKASAFSDVCTEGTEFDVETGEFSIVGSSTVTIRYKELTSGDNIAASSSVEIEAGGNADVVAPDIVGYTFDSWSLGAGVTKNTGALTDETINISSPYDGVITAFYTKKQLIYFNNTLGWSDVYVYFYSSDAYWDEYMGSGANKDYEKSGKKAYYREYHGQMTQIEGTNIWYYDYMADWGASNRGEISGYEDVVFTEAGQHTYENFHATKACRRGDFKHSLSMFVPLDVRTDYLNATEYFNNGYWMNYPDNTGYTLRIYDNNTSGALKKEIMFPFTTDKKMPISITTDLESGKTYGFTIYRADGNVYGNSGTMTNGHSGDDGQTVWEFTHNAGRSGLTTTSAGDYTFTLNYGQDASSNYNYLVGVRYPESVGDFRVQYKDGVNSTWKTSAVIPAVTETDTVSYFVRYANTPYIRVQKCTAVDGSGNPTWSNENSGSNIISSLPSAITENGVYNFIFKKSSGALVLDKAEPYTGNFYIRVDGAGSTNWDNYRAADHLMPFSEYSFNQATDPFSHYYTQWYIAESEAKNIKFVVANDYSTNISDTITRDGIANAYVDSYGNLSGRNASVRFMYNYKTNVATRRYIDGAQEDDSEFLLLIPSNSTSIYNAATAGNAYSQVKFSDNGNWVYEANVWVVPGTQYKLKSQFGVAPNIINQYFKGKETGTGEYETLVGGDGGSRMQIRLLYDFKTNRLVTGYVPSSTIDSDIELNADIMFVREHQGNVTQITFGEGNQISEIQNVYSTLKLNCSTINNSALSRYERDLYYVSFPYDVLVSDIIGFGTYGTHWIIEYYDGAERAEKGFWADSKSFWKFVTPSMKNTFKLKAGTGYIVALDLDELWWTSEDDHSSVWDNTTEVELIFPGDISSISNQSVTYTLPQHQCNIGPRFEGGEDRRVKDSHWNVLGVPTYCNTTGSFANHTDEIGGKSQVWSADNAPKYLYTWNMTDNSLSVTNATDYNYKAMHAYVVQYYGNVTFHNSTNAAPSSVIARNYTEAPIEIEFRIDLMQNDEAVDQTFVTMSNDEQVSADFAFGEDLSKEFNSGKANIYTFIADVQSAGNTLPMSEQTTVVPVGVTVAANDDYTFSIPEGTEGIGVTLIDKERGIRTSLSAVDYTVSLEEGTYNERFVLEISPIHNMPTEIEPSEVSDQQSDVRKLLIDGLLYMVRDGKVYDARGARIE
ncbi:MAG: starch-binding protein [Paludibacteraceae bacterium]|nr:starch-binding protein [Paludibacteraceae bacterium]